MSTMVLDNLRKLGEEYGVLEGHQHAIEGPVDWVIPKVSEEIVAEFVVMGNVSREGLTGISIGSTAESILDQLNTNVLMVRVSEKSGS
jgi:universal stress protein E